MRLKPKKTANSFVQDQGRRLYKAGKYFRFNVPTLGRIGLEEWEAVGTITTMTVTYLDQGEMADKTAKCVLMLAKSIPSGKSSILLHPIMGQILNQGPNECIGFPV